MKKYFRFALMAVLTVGLSMSVTSCKDDDKNDSGENMEQAESTGGDMTLAELQLASLISNFGGLEAQEQLEQSGWKSKNYEATVGLVFNESRPTVRTIEVGTVEAADEQAALLLDALGFDANNASGFTFADSEVGTISYQHGGGDANTLAVINISVKQLPNITQLQMVRQYPTNQGDSPRYKFGDIIEKNGRLWICTYPAKALGQQAYFVSFWITHPKGTCSWGKESDNVYAAKMPMASAKALGAWMVNVLLNDNNYEKIIDRLKDKNIEDMNSLNQIIPATEGMRTNLIWSLRTTGTTDEYQLIEALDQPKGIKKNTWSKKGDNGRIVAPHGRLLCDKFRWSSGFTYDYWVPQLCWVSSDDFEPMQHNLGNISSQDNSSHFKWVDYGELESKSDDLFNDNTNRYHIIKVATHWRHKYFTLDGNQYQWAVFDFTKDWSDQEADNEYEVEDADDIDWTESSRYWTRRNITSSEIIFTDNGERMKDAKEIWVNVTDKKLDDADANDESKIHVDEVKMYSIIGQDGHFYDNVQATEAAGTKAVAIVTYLGGTKRVEKGADWNGLAMALAPSEGKYFVDDDHVMTNCALPAWEAKNIHKDLTGLASTETLMGDCGHGHQHPAAKSCRDWLKDSPFTARATEFSPWFLPSYGQWVLAIKGQGYKYGFSVSSPVFLPITDSDSAKEAQQTALTNAGVPALFDVLKSSAKENLDALFWTATTLMDAQETSASRKNCVYLFQNRVNFTSTNNTDWQSIRDIELSFMPFIAFKYGGGGTMEMTFE